MSRRHRTSGGGKHRGWFVSGRDATSVGYPTKARARNVARQVQGGRVQRSGGCMLALLLLPLYLLVALIRGGAR